jgi:hypothetical protein
MQKHDSDSLGRERRPSVPMSNVVRFKTQVIEAHACLSRAGGALTTMNAGDGTFRGVSVNGGSRD